MPTPKLKQRGSRRAKARKGEPQPDPSVPECPRWLSAVARDVWADLVPQLAQMGVLGRCDRNALTRYCQMFAEWRQVTKFLMDNEETQMMRDKSGMFTKQVERPQVKRSERLASQLLALERQFGLTPSARADLAVPVQNPDENRGKDRDKGRFFGKPRLVKGGAA